MRRFNCSRGVGPVVKQVTFRATYPPELAHPLHVGVVEESDVSRAAVLQWGPTDSASTLSWFDTDRETTRALLDRVESVAATSLVEDGAGTYAFVHQTAFEFDDALMDRLGDARVVFVPPLTFLDTGAARFHAVGAADALAAFRADLAGPLDVHVERVRTFRRGPAPATLTDRQDEALSAAVAVGYYEVPRTGSVADVADRLDCAQSTAGELLRKAEARLVADHVETSEPPTAH
jgi:predicted DNA binding protein